MESTLNLQSIISSANAIIGTMERAIRAMQMARARIAGGGDAPTRMSTQSYSSNESFVDARSHLTESEILCDDRCAFSRRKLQASVECAVREKTRRLGRCCRR